MKIFYYIFILFCFFPYINLLHLGTDTQPNALLFSIIPILFFRKAALPIPIFLFGFVTLIAFLVLFMQEINFFNVRTLFNYISLFLITWGSYLIHLRMNGLSINLYKGIIWFWLFVGVVQTFFFPSFLTFLLNGGGRGITSSIRGVTSMAPEPSFYGSMCILFIILGLINFGYKKIRFFLLLLVIQIIFIAKSTTAFLPVVAAGVIFFLIKLIKFDVKLVLKSVVFIVLLIFLATPFIKKLEKSRLGNLLNVLVENPYTFVAVDESVNRRIMYSVFPFKGMVDNYFIPAGYGKFDDYMRVEDKKEKSLFLELLLRFNEPEHYVRIMSGLGAPAFQLGIFGLFIPLGIFIAFKPFLAKDEWMFSFLAFILILLTAFPLMTATIGYIIGSVLYQKKIYR